MRFEGAGGDRTTHPAWRRATWGGLLLVSLTLAVLYFPLRADDAYIVARYADNAYLGQGWTFNDGERINALTSPLHSVVLMALRTVTPDTVFWYRLIGAGIAVGVLAWVARKRWGHDATALLFLALTIASPFVMFWAVGGLETPLLLAAVTVLTALTLDSDRDNGTTKAVLVVVACGIAVFTRYDASLFVLPVLIHWLVRHRGDVLVWLAAALVGFLLACWVAFTYVYYGDILPTSFYVKAGTLPAPDDIYRGLRYAGSFLLLSLAWVAAIVGIRTTGTTASSGWWAVTVGLLVYGAYGLFAGTKHMMYGYRLFVPFLPALLLVCLQSRTTDGSTSAPKGGAVIVAACLAFQVVLGGFVYFLSQNPTIDLAWQRRSATETFEFSSFGARHTATFLDAVDAQADAIRQHWAGTNRERKMRLAAVTGGLLPYRLSDAYVLEPLVSYRHRCKPLLEPMADYQQVVFDFDRDAGELERNRIGRGMQRIHQQVFPVGGLRKEPMKLALEVWYQPNAEPLVIPPRIGEECLPGGGTGGSPK